VLSGKYRLVRVLGIGGMAAVYAATHRNGHQVAIKILHPELSLSADIRQRFVREGHAANAVAHPGVVAVIDDAVAEDGSAFLVMELLAGQSVEEMCAKNGHALDVSTVLTIAGDLCAVLAMAHRAGIVHRDLKPANLFVTNAGQLKVLDFGIARVRDAASTNLTGTGMLLGTPAFMAPEQASGQVSQIDQRTDVWAVGATMFALLSGRTVHDGETAQHIAILAATQPARSLATVAPGVPATVVALVDRALAFDKAERWPTAEAMGSAIQEVRRGPLAGNNLSIDPLGKTDHQLSPVRAVGSTTSQPVMTPRLAAPPARSMGQRLISRATRRPILVVLALAIVAIAGVGARLRIGATVAPVPHDAPDAAAAASAVPNDSASVSPPIAVAKPVTSDRPARPALPTSEPTPTRSKTLRPPPRSTGRPRGPLDTPE
jgi:serine/threonine-protein kinase